jgi:hypothetical protein
MSLEVRDYHVLKSRITVDQAKAYSFFSPGMRLILFLLLNFGQTMRVVVERLSNMYALPFNFSCSLVSPLLAK